MKKKFGKLSKREQKNVEAEYQQKNPADFDEIMSRATRETPTTVRLPHRLAEDLQRFAEQQGKSDFQNIVKSWLKERLRKEVNAAR